MENQKMILTWKNVDLKIRVNSKGSYFGKKDKELHILKNL
jgi:hypothetical protein